MVKSMATNAWGLEEESDKMQKSGPRRNLVKCTEENLHQICIVPIASGAKFVHLVPIESGVCVYGCKSD